MGPVAILPSTVRVVRPITQSSAEARIQVVVLHGSLSADRRLSEVEILASTDASLNERAIDHAIELSRSRPQMQPGSTPQSSELLLSIEFVTAR